ncbi:MAG: LLM class flavin-dependent oxidoreductase [Gaiellaceae bacterium]
MKFSVYSEIQNWEGKDPARQYEEVLEQMVHADRLGYDAYAVIEHNYFPQFSISANPWVLFGRAFEKTNQITFRSMGHVLPYINPTWLASAMAAASVMLEGRYEAGLLRGHGWLPTKTGVPVRDTRSLYEESLEIIIAALGNESFSYSGEHFEIDECHVVPRPNGRIPIYLGGTSDRTYELAAEQGWGVAVPPLLPYAALAEQMDLYRAKCAEHGTEPYIVWIHACYIDEDRDKAWHEAEKGMRQFLEGNASPLVSGQKLSPKEDMEAAGYGFYLSGIMENLAKMPYDEMIEGDVVWVGTPDEVIKRIEEVREVCDGLSEVAITVNPGGFDHWQSIKAQELFADTVMPHFRNA